jgi:hypothetical protein
MTSAIAAAPRPRRPFSSRIVFTPLVAFAIAAMAWWTIPALSPQTFVVPPVLSQQRLIELKASRVFTSRIVGLDVRASTGDTEVRLVGAYMDAEQIVLFLRVEPPARPAPTTTTLRDQFGRSYALRGETSDLATGESVLYFPAPGFPLLQTGARLTLDVSALERAGLERVPATLSMTATVLANDPSLGAYVLDMAINYLVLALAAGAYVALTIAGLRLFRIAPSTRRALLSGLASALLFVVIALPTYVAVAGLLRHDPIGPGGLNRQPDAVIVATEVVVFYLVQAAAVVIGVMRTKRVAQPRDARSRVASGALVIAFLVLIQPLAEFANACYIGWGFLLRMSC